MSFAVSVRPVEPGSSAQSGMAPGLPPSYPASPAAPESLGDPREGKRRRKQTQGTELSSVA